MTLRRLRTAVCLLAVLSICTTVLPAWAADHDANTCAAGGGGGGGGSGGGGAGDASGGVDAGGDPSGATSLQGARPYSLRAIYFRRDQFRSTADCLTAAYTQRLPLEVCQ